MSIVIRPSSLPSWPQPGLLDLLEKFIERVPFSGCWIWTGSLFSNDYAYLRERGASPRRKKLLAHRLSYEFFIGTIPCGLRLDHLCRVRCCINPAHLEPVTHRVNCLRGEGLENARQSRLNKTHCPAGHPYSGGNLYIKPNGDGRGCKECAKLRMRVRRALCRSS